MRGPNLYAVAGDQDDRGRPAQREKLPIQGKTAAEEVRVDIKHGKSAGGQFAGIEHEFKEQRLRKGIFVSQGDLEAPQRRKTGHRIRHQSGGGALGHPQLRGAG